MCTTPKNSSTSIVIVLALILAFALSGCGGGGGGTMPPPMTPPDMTPPDPRQVMLDKINEIEQTEGSSGDDDVEEDILRTTEIRPSGLNSRSLGVSSTTQASRQTNGVSSVWLSFLAEYDADGMLQFTARTFGDDYRTATISTTDQDAMFERLDGIPAADWKGVELQSETNSSYHYADLFTDIENDADTDYLAMGYWVVVRKEPSTSSTNYDFFVAAGGSDFFEAGNVAGLTGPATYEGPATGLHMKKENAAAAPVVDYFRAKASLIADFGDPNALGTISGTITEGTTAGGEPLPELTLECAAMTRSGSNFYGNTSGNGLTGKWGGKFYSDGAALTDHPGSAAGTFGAKTADDLQSLIGAFAAYKN